MGIGSGNRSRACRDQATVTVQPHAATSIGPGDPADVELWQAVVDEALITIWRAEITLSGHHGAAALLGGGSERLQFAQLPAPGRCVVLGVVLRSGGHPGAAPQPELDRQPQQVEISIRFPWVAARSRASRPTHPSLNAIRRRCSVGRGSRWRCRRGHRRVCSPRWLWPRWVVTPGKRLGSAAAKLQAAQAGRFRGGRWPFGFEADGVTVRPGEADVVADAAPRVLHGETPSRCQTRR
jgi:hypothetical protein